MSSAALSVLLFLAPLLAAAQQYTPAAAGSKVEFRINGKQDGDPVVVRGSFGGIRGTIVFDTANLKSAAIDVTVSLAAISTGNTIRDKELKSVTYFDVAKSPVARIQSQRITFDQPGGLYTLTGMLTLRGITKAVKIPFMAVPVTGGYVLRGSFDVSRQVFGLGPKGTMDDNVSVYLRVKALKK